MNPDRDLYFGSHQLIARIGRGGMAEVFLAKKLGASGFVRRVVIKSLHEHLCGNPDAENRFVEEAVLGGQLDHNNIVRVLELGRSGGRVFMVMEYVDGLDLKSMLNANSGLPVWAALHVGREIARALHYAHLLTDDYGTPLNIVHRDVSPSNILVSRDGRVKLADFGVAKALGREKTRGGIVKGKYAYMSPEQVAQDPIDARSDQFSLGSLLVETLTGEAMFQGTGPLQIMEAVLEAPTPQLPQEAQSLVPELQVSLSRMMAADPEDRYPDLGLVADELARLLLELGVATPEEALSDLVAEVLHDRPRHSAERSGFDTNSATLSELARPITSDSETDHFGNADVPPHVERALSDLVADVTGAAVDLGDETSKYELAELRAGLSDS